MADDPMGTGATETEEPMTTEQLLTAIREEQAAHRAEVQALREQIDAQKPSAPTGVIGTLQSAEDRLHERLAEIANHSHYCPGCGNLGDYPQKCQGSPTAPHQPIEMVSTDELQQEDPSKHTAAPATTNLG